MCVGGAGNSVSVCGMFAWALLQDWILFGIIIFKLYFNIDAKLIDSSLVRDVQAPCSIAHRCLVTCDTITWHYHMTLSHDAITWHYHMTLSHDAITWCYHRMLSHDTITWHYHMTLSHDIITWCYHMTLSHDAITWRYHRTLSHGTITWHYHMTLSRTMYNATKTNVVTWPEALISFVTILLEILFSENVHKVFFCVILRWLVDGQQCKIIPI